MKNTQRSGLREQFQTFLFFFSSTLLALQYAGNRRPDIFYYIDSAKNVISGQNPYLFGARWGTFGHLIFSPLILIEQQWLVISFCNILLNALGIYLTIKVFDNDKKILNNGFLPLLRLLSPIREIFALGQINGILLGLFSAAWGLSEKSDLGKFRLLMSSLLLAVCIDTKPHIFLPLALLLISKKKYELLIFVFSSLIVGHLVIDMYIGTFTEFNWVRVLSSLGGSGPTDETKNVWTVLSSNSIHYNKLQSLAFIATVVWITFAPEKMMKGKTRFYFAALVPSLGIYYHLYDFALVLIITLGLVDRARLGFGINLLMLFNLVPQEFQRKWNVIAILLTAVYVEIQRKQQVSDKSIKSLCLSVLGAVGVYFSIQFLFLELFPSIQERISAVVVVISAIGLFLMVGERRIMSRSNDDTH